MKYGRNKIVKLLKYLKNKHLNLFPLDNNDLITSFPFEGTLHERWREDFLLDKVSVKILIEKSKLRLKQAKFCSFGL